jgi:hypothetical protein
VIEMRVGVGDLLDELGLDHEEAPDPLAYN